MRRWGIAAALTVALGGCGPSLPDPGAIHLSAPLALPQRARVMIDIAPPDLDRKFSYKLNTVSRQTTDIGDGAAMAQAASGLLGHAFAATSVNQASPSPEVVARITGTAVFDRVGGTFRVECGLDAARADGIPFGHFYNVYKSPPVLSLEDNLPRVYAQCLKGPVEDMLRSPEFTTFAAAGFPALDPATVAGYLRSQGYAVR